ncbi:hypothetical protein HNY73_003275 [Argiope bruennichi]|uniref:Uncharacterized protein n=1 Tax=Argiope bruennichi TaxID=94029 RepID=A0A8T0FYT6_ARGBR|nr:hypothetical protein HNY73_003275 [Argiope bruennichi]
MQVDFYNDEFHTSQFRDTPCPIDKTILDSRSLLFPNLLHSLLPSLSSLSIQLIHIYLRTIRDCIYKDLLECSEEYNIICLGISTAWKFCIKFQVVFDTGTVQCTVNMKRMDGLPFPLKILWLPFLCHEEGIQFVFKF